MIRFLETEQKHGVEWHWFDVDGSEYAVVCGDDPEPYLIDHNGSPINSCNDHGGILDNILPLVPDPKVHPPESRQLLLPRI